MSDERRPLHEAILAADPRDDLEPLVFADWLEEQGRASQAEFLRIQRELVGMPAGGNAHDLLIRRDELFLSVRTWYDFPADWYSAKKVKSYAPRQSYPKWLERTILSPNQYLLGYVCRPPLRHRSSWSWSSRSLAFSPF